jgi:hypothetical protein
VCTDCDDDSDIWGPYTVNRVVQHCVLCNMIDRVWLVCGIQYKAGEDWVHCLKLELWTQIACSGHSTHYVCTECDDDSHLRGRYTVNHVVQHCVLCNMIDRVWLVCGIQYKAGEGWVQCLKCELWAQFACSGHNTLYMCTDCDDDSDLRGP